MKFISQQVSFCPKRVLEVGCGRGDLSRILAKYFQYSEVLAIDLSEKMIERARNSKNPKNLSFQVKNFFDLEGTFDIVISVHAFEEIDLGKGLHHLKNLLIPQGVAILVVSVTGVFSRLYSIARKMVYRDGFHVRQPDEWVSSSNEVGFNTKVFPMVEFERAVLLALKRVDGV